MREDRKHMIGSARRHWTAALLPALLAILIPVPASHAGPLLTSLTIHLESSQAELSQLATTKAKSRAPKVVTVKNLMVARSGDSNSLVLELAKPVKFTQRRMKNPDRLVIDLKNVILTATARRKVNDDSFPVEIEVSQFSSRNVRVVLDMDGIADVKLRKLTSPHRLVIEYVPEGALGVPTTKPTITLPPMSRQITQAERQARLDIQTIVLDPGHGGKDAGAVGRGGLTEKEVALDVGLRLRNLLMDRLNKKVLMTRDKDEFIELDDRAKFANRHKADLFVSIHINSHPKRTTRGVEMYHFGIASDRRAMEVAARENGDTISRDSDILDMIKADLALSKRIEDSQNLAWETKIAVVNLVGAHFDTEDHGVKTAPFYVLRYTAMPSILAELAFISNPVEEKRLRQTDFRQKAAEGLFEGIRNYLNSVQVAFAR
jgi:N-acetylmuramoyl-L-alanine amidase